jgi:hypothetical protein
MIYLIQRMILIPQVIAIDLSNLEIRDSDFKEKTKARARCPYPYTFPNLPLKSNGNLPWYVSTEKSCNTRPTQPSSSSSSSSSSSPTHTKPRQIDAGGVCKQHRPNLPPPIISDVATLLTTCQTTQKKRGKPTRPGKVQVGPNPPTLECPDQTVKNR